jgi:hypothetical protein
VCELLDAAINKPRHENAFLALVGLAVVPIAIGMGVAEAPSKAH